jgi:hypothetical protein
MGRALVRLRPAAAIVAVGATLVAGPSAIAQAISAEFARQTQDTGADELRAYIGEQVGGIDKLKVPATNAEIPVPLGPDGKVPYRYQLTEAKRYLGKLLFHDPVRTVRVDINRGQPKDLPGGTSFGGTFNATDPLVQQILPETSKATITDVNDVVADTIQTGSCGSCHIGEAAGKAGQRLNFNVGGEGRGYTDEAGHFFPRRRPQAGLQKLRSEPIFEGDVLVDALPTLTDIWSNAGTKLVTTPAYYYHLANPNDPSQALIATGRLDQLDSVGRMSPAMVGFAFNNRLLLGGFAGEPQSTPGSLNPLKDPAQENLTLLLLDAHRMLNYDAETLRGYDTFKKLFKDAFPEEAAADKGDYKTLITDDTVLRATSTFLRTVVTRNTRFDHFLAGDNNAMTAAEIRGAKLFFTPATGGAGGAGCFTRHSGPMLNKQPNDKDVTGVGAFVEENFFNIGIGDHPVQALNALARGHLDPTKLGKDGYPYHAEDIGRQEVTHQDRDAFRFRSLTLRQLKDGRNFMHNGSFTKIRDVVQYFNAGMAQDPTAGAAPTLTSRFTHPRGSGYPRGLGLTEQQVDDLTIFLENALYDPALVHYDPNSTTDTLQPNERDLTYSKYHPELIALGARDGLMLSKKAIDDNDPLARRDEGFEFLNVTSEASVTLVSRSVEGAQQNDLYKIENKSNAIIDTNLLIVVDGKVQLINSSGNTTEGSPYLRVFINNGELLPGQSTWQTLSFKTPNGSALVNYSLELWSGQGKVVKLQ